MVFLRRVCQNTPFICTTFIINLASWLFFFQLLIVLVVYRTCIDLILRIKLGNIYGGLLDKCDAFLCTDDASKAHITAVLFIKSDKKLDLLYRLRKILQEKIFDHPQSYPKLTSSKRDFGGYPYWIKNGCQLSDVLRHIHLPNDSVFNEEYLKEVAGKNFTKEFVKNGSILWELHVGERPLEGNYNDKYYRYPIIVRCHHAIADGTSLMLFLTRILGDEILDSYDDNVIKKAFNEVTKHKSKQSRIASFISITGFWLDLIFLSLGRVVQWNQLRSMDINALHSSRYSEDKIAAWTIEENVECIPMVKNIKNQAHTKFTRVVIAAVLTSLTNYFKKNSLPTPNHITGALMGILYYPQTNISEPVKLQNKTTISFFELPCCTESGSLISTLSQVEENMANQIKYADILVARFLCSFVSGYIPRKLIIPILGFDSQTFILSNVPGGSLMKVLDGCVLDKIIGLAPNVKAVGVTFTVLSYDNRLQIGVLVDKTLINNQHEVQGLVEDVLVFIKKMDKESRKYSGNL